MNCNVLAPSRALPHSSPQVAALNGAVRHQRMAMMGRGPSSSTRRILAPNGNVACRTTELESAGVTTLEAPPPPPTALGGIREDAPVLKWFERPCKWETVSTLEELEAAMQDHGGKFVAVDFFAGWCSSCKGAFPGLCKIPNDRAMSQSFKFVKANIEDEALAAFVRKMCIPGIPYMAIYNPEGRMLLGMSASFKKMAQVKASLAVIAANPEAKRFVLDPQGVAEPA